MEKSKTIKHITKTYLEILRLTQPDLKLKPEKVTSAIIKLVTYAQKQQLDLYDIYKRFNNIKRVINHFPSPTLQKRFNLTPIIDNLYHLYENDVVIHATSKYDDVLTSITTDRLEANKNDRNLVTYRLIININSNNPEAQKSLHRLEEDLRDPLYDEMSKTNSYRIINSPNESNPNSLLIDDANPDYPFIIKLLMINFRNFDHVSIDTELAYQDHESNRTLLADTIITETLTLTI